jgi:membrane protein
MNRKEFVAIAIVSLRMWQHNNATLRAAALSFFIILPLPSLLLISMDIYSQFLGQAQGTVQFIQLISALVGPTIATLVSELLKGAANPFNSVFNSFVSVVFAVAGVVGAFAVLQDTFNVLWDVELPTKRSIKVRMQERFVPFVSVLGASAVVIGLLESTTLLSNTVQDALAGSMGAFAASAILFSVQTLFSFASAVLLFAIIFKEIPDTAVEWRDVWVGAIITAIAFAILNNVFRFYLQSFPVTSLAGAAGSLIILLLWVFVIAQILLYGAQFTHCLAETVGSHSKKGKDHEHPYKRGIAAEVLEFFREETDKSRVRKNEKESKINANAKTKTENIGPAYAKNEEKPAAEPAKQPSSASEAKKEAHPQELQPQVTFSEKESSSSTEKEYDLSFAWKTKKKSPPEEKEN